MEGLAWLVKAVACAPVPSEVLKSMLPPSQRGPQTLPHLPADKGFAHFRSVAWLYPC